MTRIRLLREIGEGGMGQVFEARVEAPGGLGVPVAVKFVRTMRPGKRWQERFARELETALTLGHKHPNLLRTIWFGVKSGTHPYLVMELAAGSIDRLHGNVPLQARVIRKVAHDMLQALAFLHSHGILHRDVSCGNIMVSRDGRILLGDFGLARDRDGHSSGGVRGTPAYIAREIFEGHAHTAASDAYALGVVLYRLVMGVSPYGQGDATEVYKALLSESLPAPLPVDLPDDLVQVITGLIQLDPRKRLTVASAQAILEASTEDMATAAEIAALVDEGLPGHTESSDETADSLPMFQDAVLRPDVEFIFGDDPPGPVRAQPALAWLPWAVTCLALMFTVYMVRSASNPDQARLTPGEEIEQTAGKKCQPDSPVSGVFADGTRGSRSSVRFKVLP